MKKPEKSLEEQPEDNFIKFHCDNCGVGLVEICCYEETDNPHGEVLVKLFCEDCGNTCLPLSISTRYGISPFWVSTGENIRDDYKFTSFIFNRWLDKEKKTELVKVRQIK